LTAARAIVEEPTVAVSANRRSSSLSRDKRHRRKSPLYLASKRRAYTVEYNLGRTIGTDVAGNAASNIRVYVRDSIIQTAFPF
jgi:hypothetical protein